MKKIRKLILLTAVMLAAVLSLTGCTTINMPSIKWPSSWWPFGKPSVEKPEDDGDTDNEPNEPGSKPVFLINSTPERFTMTELQYTEPNEWEWKQNVNGLGVYSVSDLIYVGRPYTTLSYEEMANPKLFIGRQKAYRSFWTFQEAGSYTVYLEFHNIRIPGIEFDNGLGLWGSDVFNQMNCVSLRCMGLMGETLFNEASEGLGYLFWLYPKENNAYLMFEFDVTEGMVNSSYKFHFFMLLSLTNYIYSFYPDFSGSFFSMDYISIGLWDEDQSDVFWKEWCEINGEEWWGD